MEAIDGDVADCSQRLALVTRARALRAILQHFDSVLAGDRQDSVHVAGAALKVHGHDGLGLGRNSVLDILGIDVERLIAFGKNGKCARQHYGVIAGIPCPRRENHLVARADAKSRHGDLERGSSRGDP